jgi:hypothetical protein
MPYNGYISQLFERKDFCFVINRKSVLKNPFAVVFGFEIPVRNPFPRFVTVTPESPSFELTDQQMVDFRKHFF